MKNICYNTHDVKKCCENKLFISFKPGKEFNGWVKLNSKKIARITIPKGRKFIPPKTYKTMAMQLKLTVTEFDDLLECINNYQEYISIVKDKI